MVEFDGTTLPLVFEKFFKGKYIWSYTNTNVPSAPATVTVSGPEGEKTVSVVVK